MKYGFLTALLVLSLIPAARAAEPKVLFVPTSAWLVGSASVAPTEKGESNLPCIMMDQYDNGFTFRFSGGNKRILAAAVDFRQAAFTAGTHYPVTVDIPPAFSQKMDAVAYNEAILILNVKDSKAAQDLYSAVANGQELHLGLGKKTLDFALLGASDGLQRVDACYGPSAQKTQQQSDAPAPEINPEPAPLPDTAVLPTDHHLQISPSANGEDTGQKVDEVLNQATDALKVPPAGVKTVSKPIASAASPVAWQATRGASLRETLEAWTSRNNTDLIWKAPQDFQVHETMGSGSSFEQAVQTLLEQYVKDKTRPVGHIYKNPDLGKLVLLVQQDGN